MEDFKVYQSSGYLKKLVTDASDVRKTYEEISGSLVEFDTYISAPLAELVVDINPVQDLHGQDAPYPAGGGVNKWSAGDQTVVEYKLIPITIPAGNWTFSALVTSTTELSHAILFKENADGTGNTVGVTTIGNGTGRKSNSFGLSAEAKSIALYAATAWNESQGQTTTYTDIQLESGTTQTPYSPYSNICPITGWTGANVYHSGEDTSNPTVYAVSWQDDAGTVYGGTLDVVSGVLTVTDVEIASYNGETLPSTWISDRDVYAVGTSPTIGAQVVYKLATPLTYQLTPQEINTLIGVNNIWADTGDVSVKYRTH